MIVASTPEMLLRAEMTNAQMERAASRRADVLKWRGVHFAARRSASVADLLS